MLEILLDENGCIFSCKSDELIYLSELINKVYSKTEKRNYDIAVLPISDQSTLINNRVKEIMASLSKNEERNKRQYDYLNLRQSRYSFLISQGMNINTGININKEHEQRLFSAESVVVDINGCLDMIVGFIRIRTIEDCTWDQIRNPERTICDIPNMTGLHMLASNYSTDKEHNMAYKQLKESLNIFGYNDYIKYIVDKTYLEMHFDDAYNCKLITVGKDSLVELPIGSLNKTLKPNMYKLTSLRNESLRNLLYYFGISVDRRGWKKEFFDKNLHEVDWSDVRLTQLFIDKIIN